MRWWHWLDLWTDVLLAVLYLGCAVYASAAFVFDWPLTYIVWAGVAIAFTLGSVNRVDHAREITGRAIAKAHRG